MKMSFAKATKRSIDRLNSESGNAMIETLPIMVIFVWLLGFGLGFFGFVHTAIMNSMAARTYAFETFRNRADVTYFREETTNGQVTHYQSFGNRFHAVNNETNALNKDTQLATVRPISFGVKEATSKSSVLDHNAKIYEIAGRNRKGNVEASPAWVMVGYGICLNVQCGDQ